jgi:hypothetical protein
MASQRNLDLLPIDTCHLQLRLVLSLLVAAAMFYIKARSPRPGFVLGDLQLDQKIKKEALQNLQKQHSRDIMRYPFSTKIPSATSH